MLRGLYTAASGMMSNEILTDTIANNLANINTIGFKRSEVSFQEFDNVLVNRIDAQGSKVIGTMSMGAEVSATTMNFAQGGMRDTGNPLDFAIDGPGFFTVKDGKGNTYYTRDGNFTINSNGFLCTHNGELVQGQNGNISIPTDKEISSTGLGQLEAAGQPFDSLLISKVENPHSLEKIGGNLLKATPTSKIIPKTDNPGALGYKIQQRTLEMSNANPITELINSITGQRLYESLQKSIHIQNETLGKAVNEVGKYI